MQFLCQILSFLSWLLFIKREISCLVTNTDFFQRMTDVSSQGHSPTCEILSIDPSLLLTSSVLIPKLGSGSDSSSVRLMRTFQLPQAVFLFPTYQKNINSIPTHIAVSHKNTLSKKKKNL